MTIKHGLCNILSPSVGGFSTFPKTPQKQKYRNLKRNKPKQLGGGWAGKRGDHQWKKKKKNIWQFSSRWNVLVACDECYKVRSEAQPWEPVWMWEAAYLQLGWRSSSGLRVGPRGRGWGEQWDWTQTGAQAAYSVQNTSSCLWPGPKFVKTYFLENNATKY